jgi:hypothetical protein
MIKNSNIDSDICVPHLSATYLKPLKLKGFTIAHLNIRNLVKNIDQFRLYLHKQQFDVICINETRLDATVPKHEVGINGYEIVRKDRNQFYKKQRGLKQKYIYRVYKALKRQVCIFNQFHDTYTCKVRNELNKLIKRTKADYFTNS